MRTKEIVLKEISAQRTIAKGKHPRCTDYDKLLDLQAELITIMKLSGEWK